MTDLPQEPSPLVLAEAPSLFAKARRAFHAALIRQVLFCHDGIAANADSSNPASIAIAKSILSQLGEEVQGRRLPGQQAGNKFEEIVGEFVKQTFGVLTHLRPGSWLIEQITGRNQSILARFEQYAHLDALARAMA